MNDKDTVYTMGEAAKIMGVTRQAIWLAVSRGQLVAQRHRHIVLITPAALEKYMNNGWHVKHGKTKSAGKG